MFRLLNVEGQAALEVDGAWYAVDRLGDDPALSDPMQAIARFAELHELTRIVADADEEGAGALVASALPDGLEKLSEDIGIAANARTMFQTPLADYEAAFLGNPILRKAAPGVLGLAAVYLVCVVTGRMVSRRALHRS